MARPPGDALGGVAERRQRHQAARVDRVDGDVGAHRGVGRGAQLRGVVGAVQAQAAAEVDERLLLGERPQHGDGRLQRRELPVGVEDVELGVALAEGRRLVGLVADAVAVLVLAVDQHVDDVADHGAIGGEVLLDADRAALVGHDRHQVRRRHLRRHVLDRGLKRAQLVAGAAWPTGRNRESAAGGRGTCCRRRPAARTAAASRGPRRPAAGWAPPRPSGAAAGAGSVASRWNSTNAMSCGWPSSVMTKSLAVSPSIGRPSLSFTVTVCTMSRVLDRKIG